MSLQDKLKEIEERAKAATEGPWTFTPADDFDDWTICNAEFTFVKQDDSGVPVSKDDGEFIAHARQDIPKLLAVIKLLIEQRDYHYQALPDIGLDPKEKIIGDLNSKLAKILEGEKWPTQDS